jgi:hypothetical protein
MDTFEKKVTMQLGGMLLEMLRQEVQIEQMQAELAKLKEQNTEEK